MTGWLPSRRGLPALAALGPVLGLAFVFVLFLVLKNFDPPSVLDLRNVAVHAVIVATVGIGMTFVLISGGIDLSVGSSVALASVAAALAARAEWSVVGIGTAALSAGLACGLYNGLLIGALRLPAFIVTLGTLGFFRGVAKWAARSEVVYGPTHGLEVLMRPEPPSAWWLAAPAAWIVALLALSGWILLGRTVIGRHWTAIGDNAEAARYAAVPLARRRVQVYALAGLLVGVAGFFQFARITGGDPTISVGLELDVIAAAVIGGASLSGGAGSVWGTVCGAVMMAFLRNRCTALGWPNFVQEMIVGHIIIAAVALDMLRRRRGG
jgi:ribose transport system permease protein